MQLSIDTTNNLKTIVKIGKVEVVKDYQNPRMQNVLELIEQTIKKAKVEKKQITKIKVNPGPGSFTSTRVGVAVANALGFALKIPVNGSKPGKYVKPIYDKPPSITKPREE